MKKLLLVCFLLLMAGCNSNPDSIGSPPPVSIKIGETSYRMERGSYSWSKELLFETEMVIADAASPYQIAQEIDTYTVKKNDTMEIVTSGNPYLSVYLWDSSGRINEMQITDKKITAPDDSGEYIYEVFGEWENGDGSYTIVLEIE